MLILGTIASSKFVETDTGAMYPLQNIVVGSAGASFITFNNIPNTYTHLQVRIMSLASYNGNQSLSATYNSDTGSNYSSHWLTGNGSAASAGTTTNDNIQYYGFGLWPNEPVVSVIDILDYANTNKYKTMRCLTGLDRNGSGHVYLFTGSWRNTNAITSIKIAANSGNFNQYSSFSLYGIKAA